MKIKIEKRKVNIRLTFFNGTKKDIIVLADDNKSAFKTLTNDISEYYDLWNVAGIEIISINPY